jgi:hypothetical protein
LVDPIHRDSPSGQSEPDAPAKRLLPMADMIDLAALLAAAEIGWRNGWAAVWLLASLGAVAMISLTAGRLLGL